MTQRLITSILISTSMVLSSCTHSPQADVSTTTEVPREPSSQASTPWTDWSEKGDIAALYVLKGVRDKLFDNNLNDPHVGYFGYKPVDCSKVDTRFRTADGTCNDTSVPLMGAAGVAFGRNVKDEFIDKKAAEKIMTPNPGLVSKELFTRDEFKPVPFLNMLAAVWIQFMNHDWLTHGPNMTNNPWEVKMPDGSTMNIDKTQENPANKNQYRESYGKVTANDVTHWWDASQIYGSSQEQQNAVRAFSMGRMRTEMVNGRELLPKNPNFNPADNRQNNGYEVTGFRDNWWLGLSMLHTLFVEEHNSIAVMLTSKHVKYDKKTKKFTWTNGNDVRVFDEKQLDEHLFQTARLINAAILAKIHTVEWTPAILANKTLRKAMYTNWYGMANPQTWSRIIKYIPGFDKTDWFKSINSGYLIGGVVGDKTNHFKVPYSITEEFTSVYRLHSLLPEAINLKRLGLKEVQAVPFDETRNDKAYPIMANYDMKDLFYSFGTQLPGQLVLNNFPKFMQNLEIPGHGSMDLAMVDVLRDRERGVPRYNQFRRGINLTPITKYSDFFPGGKAQDARQQAILEKFYKVYGRDSKGRDNVEMIDLLVGTSAEEVKPKGFGFGETMFQIFILMASRRLMSDRFFTTDYRPAYYTQSGLDWIDHEGTLAQVITRHMPQLYPKVKGLESAFSPWNK